MAGKSFRDLKPTEFPPCVKERGSFMADFPFERKHAHPYARPESETHAHFAPTTLRHPAYSAAALPFRWMMKPIVFDGENGSAPLTDLYPLEELDRRIEKDIEEQLGFNPHWFQDHRNHRTLLECFWRHVRIDESLVFYAKQVPLVEDTGRRVLIGAGRVTALGGLTEYEYNRPADGKIRSLLWERMVQHSIRPDFADGFLLPYQQALEASQDGTAFDPAEVVAFAPDDRFTEFSFATEHVGNDAAIESLLACRAALLRSAELFSIDIRKQDAWIDKEVGRLWKKRGPFPGLGAILRAEGVPLGHFVAQSLMQRVGEDGNPWEAIPAMLENPHATLPSDLARHVGPSFCKAWKRIFERKPERRAFLELISRVGLTDAQAAFITIPEVRKEGGVDLTDSQYLENPYLLYETTRHLLTPIAVDAVDRGMFPPPLIRERYPVPGVSEIKTAVDERRLRALTVRELEAGALLGHTLLPREDIITSLRSADIQKLRHDGAATEVTAELLEVAEDEQFEGVIHCVRMRDGRQAYQLARLADMGSVIRDRVRKSLSEQARRHELEADWRKELDRYLERNGTAQPEDEQEERARTEKAAALQELAASRFSVLIGPAGTGKTTLLSVLCQQPQVSQGSILLLAPTGKARVRMEDVARRAGTGNFEARTLAQHLSRSGRYDGELQRYQLNDEPPEKSAHTVIVDECSMLTEEMLAALLQSLAGVQRLILVGDPRQLPPIGAGRPFVDIVAHLAPENVESMFPRVSRGYAELTVPRRQGSGERDDLQLASWFGGSRNGPGDDRVFEILAGQRKSETIHFIRWETPDELEQAIPRVLAEHLGFDPAMKETQAFARATGAVLDERGSAWFNTAWRDRPGSGRAADAWQILTPVRQKPWGVDPLNRLIHQRYKGEQVVWARNQKPWARSIPPPMGEMQILYGDKVINNRNWSVSKNRMFPKPETWGYLANGEIGVVVGHRKTKKRSWNPENLEIEFSTQPGIQFTYYPSDFGEEKESGLELAYALTIHKAQGSEFDVVFLVLPRSPLMLSRELLYTALTRQKRKVIVLHQGDATALQRLSGEQFSAAACRLTNLFRPPSPVQIRGRKEVFLEENLIHITARGDAVRSKSEVIIANMLHAKGIDYHYEAPLEINGITKYPDFTLEDDSTGVTFFWEHCGMLHDPAYRARWEEKRAWYASHGITEAGSGSRRLIVTRDQPNGGFDAAAVAAIIETLC